MLKHRYTGTQALTIREDTKQSTYYMYMYPEYAYIHTLGRDEKDGVHHETFQLHALDDA